MSNANLERSTNDKLKELKDEEIVEKAKNGDELALDYIINKYKDVVNMKVGKYFMVGAEREDIVQEGLIGLYKAIKGFDTSSENSSFKTFANICIERQLITAIKTSNRQKHMPLNSYLSLNMSAYENDEADTVIDILDSNTTEDPLETITKKEYYIAVEDAIDKSLSDFEKRVLNRFAQGESYVQIADKLNTPVKSIDNAIQRIRKKAIRNIAEN